MKMFGNIGAGALVPLFVLIASGGTHAFASTLAWDITGGISLSLSGTPRANGAQFNISTAGTVTALGMWDEGSAALLNVHTVQLWSDTGTLLASTTVSNSSFAVASGDATGQWLFTTISPLVLTPGTYRVAVGYGVANDDPVRSTTTVVTSIGATYLQEAFTTSSTSTTDFPNNLTHNPLFGANVLFASVTTPEPSTFAGMLAAIALVLLCRRSTAPVR